MQTKEQRIEVANRFVKIISEHGRKFFERNGKVGYFDIEHGHVVWHCEVAKKRIWLSYKYWSFGNGGTMRALINALANYIREGGELPMRHLGPWPKWIGGDGDMWGYGTDEMEKVRTRCAELRKSLETNGK